MVGCKLVEPIYVVDVCCGSNQTGCVRVAATRRRFGPPSCPVPNQLTNQPTNQPVPNQLSRGSPQNLVTTAFLSSWVFGPCLLACTSGQTIATNVTLHPLRLAIWGVKRNVRPRLVFPFPYYQSTHCQWEEKIQGNWFKRQPNNCNNLFLETRQKEGG